MTPVALLDTDSVRRSIEYTSAEAWIADIDDMTGRPSKGIGEHFTLAAVKARDYIERGEDEMLRLERQMHGLAWDDPERAKVVRQYDAICDKLGVPSGDK